MRVPEIVKNIIAILGATILVITLTTFVIMESQFTRKWKAEVKYPDGTTVVYTHWTRHNCRPEPDTGGVWVLRMNQKEKNHYIIIPRDAKIEFTLIETLTPYRIY